LKVIGLTGGIGSGKTTVLRFFSQWGIPVYIADTEAKKITNTSKQVREQLISLLGEKAYHKGTLNREFVAKKIFNDTALLKRTNSIIHPEVRAHFKDWVKKQEGPYCIKESALLFENDSYKNCFATILITAPLEERIQRVIDRDQTTRKSVLERIKNQWSDNKKSALATFQIENISLAEAKQLAFEIHQRILKTLINK